VPAELQVASDSSPAPAAPQSPVPHRSPTPTAHPTNTPPTVAPAEHARGTRIVTPVRPVVTESSDDGAERTDSGQHADDGSGGGG
jgi:hypothetical protein